MRNPDVRIEGTRLVSSYPENNWYISVGDLVEERVFTDHRRPDADGSLK